MLKRRRRRKFSDFGVLHPVEDLLRILDEEGVRVLQDEHVELTAHGSPFAVVGLRDVFLFDADCDAAWDGLAEQVPTIAMAHSPDSLPGIARRGARVAFFGHTHGGQVRLPFVGAVVTRSHLPGSMASGAFRRGQTAFIINNGLGTSPQTPYRLLCRPEVTVARIVRGVPPSELTPLREVPDA
jgi:predicted MPP superfamily phosphohydrolase